MKTTTTLEQMQAIGRALQRIHIRPFRCESSDPKYNAQRNLSGKTHYVDDDTLRFHKSRVLGTCIIHNGLLLRVTCSDSLDARNTKRGYRCAVFDVFGHCVSRPKLEDAYSTKQAAINASEKEEIDLVAHYQKAIETKREHAQSEILDCNEALGMFAQPESVAA